jgi:hypothetical protein
VYVDEEEEEEEEEEEVVDVDEVEVLERGGGLRSTRCKVCS